MNDNFVLLIGTGPMAVAYAEVLLHLKINFSVVGRGLDSAKTFEEKTGVAPITGGITSYLRDNQVPTGAYVIVATGTEALMPTLLLLANLDVSAILVEKPAAISIDELLREESNLLAISAKTFVAYNRRFYASVCEVEKLVAQDGGLQSLQFEFTEWVHKIADLQKAPGVKENLFFANSTHVVDLAFYLAGRPLNWSAYSKVGSLSWHPITNFAGAGLTDRGVVFSYASNWESAGRWSVELLTKNRRIYLKPLEGLAVQMKGSIAIENVNFNDALDKQFKPGVFLQTKAFLENDTKKLLSLKNHIALSRDVYQIILNGTDAVV